MAAAQIQGDLLPIILMIVDRDIVSIRRNRRQRFPPQMGQSVIAKLRFLPRDSAQAIQVQVKSLYLTMNDADLMREIERMTFDHGKTEILGSK